MERSKETFREYPEYQTLLLDEKLRMATACLELVSVPGMLTDDTIRKCDNPKSCCLEIPSGINFILLREKEGRHKY